MATQIFDKPIINSYYITIFDLTLTLRIINKLPLTISECGFISFGDVTLNITSQEFLPRHSALYNKDDCHNCAKHLKRYKNKIVDDYVRLIGL